MAGDQFTELFCNELVKATNKIEDDVDREIEKLNDLSNMPREKFLEEMSSIRSQRLAALKKESEMRKLYLSQGHGSYDELSNEREFFDVTKTSERVVIHFYETGNMKCKILDHHFKWLTAKHVETKFIKIELQRVPFLKQSFKIEKKIPTVLVIISNMVKGKIVNFEDITNVEDHSYKLLEWKIAQLKAINYEEDLTHPPEMAKQKKQNIRKIIKDSNDDSSDADE